MPEWLPEIDEWRAHGTRIAIATVVSVHGSAPRPIGARMVVAEDGSFAGSVSGGCVETAVILAAQEILQRNTSELVHYGITDDMAFEVGLACGGAIDVWIQPLGNDSPFDRAREVQARGEPGVVITTLDGPNAGDQSAPDEFTGFVQKMVDDGTCGILTEGDVRTYVEVWPPHPELIIFGAVHAAQPLSRWAQDLGYRVTLVDARTALATEVRFPDVDRILHLWPEDAFAELTIGPHSAIAILSHDPKFDEPAIAGALATDAAYIGAIGSRKTHAERRDRLMAEGYSPAQIARVHGPIGLDIGGKTPEEMAISILAEVIATKYDKPIARRDTTDA